MRMTTLGLVCATLLLVGSYTLYAQKRTPTHKIPQITPSTTLKDSALPFGVRCIPHVRYGRVCSVVFLPAVGNAHLVCGCIQKGSYMRVSLQCTCKGYPRTQKRIRYY